MRSQRVFPAVVEGYSWEVDSIVTIALDERLILLTIHYARLARSLKSHYFRPLAELSNRYQESAGRRCLWPELRMQTTA